MSSILAQYEPLDVIGNGSFGIIRKVRRRSDGMVFARKELNFERMSERDRKQIVSEVNILKDLHHENIVRYHDRHIDRDAGILYILMEYCGGGDLSSVIKQAQRQGRPVPEDTIWNYFMQILLALNHCHHPGGQRLSGGAPGSADEKERRPQILHRDLKPDNVFLDENHTIKLGDFGLSKALSQASFAQTYVGTPYYMSPELMQEKAYDSKSDIWSLGCLIYELCAHKPPFHEAKTHAELSILIRNGRIPPLPKGYSPSLASVIKAMLNLNPAMRPSAAQLLQHERLDLAFKVSETQKMLTAVKTHKAGVLAREREVAAREANLNEKEATLAGMLTQKDAEIASLRSLIATAETQHQIKVREALTRREEELRTMVLKQEQEVALRMAKREEEIMEAVRKREEEIAQMWANWERTTREGMCRAVEERMSWVKEQTEEIERERENLENAKRDLERKLDAVEREASSVTTTSTGPRKTPLEEVKNIMAMARSDEAFHQTPARTSRLKSVPPVFDTPMHRTSDCAPPSAMKGVILTSTGETLATPSPAEFARLFQETPKVKLNFTSIFDFDSEGESLGETGYETDTRTIPDLMSTAKKAVPRKSLSRDYIPPTSVSASEDEDDEDDENDIESTPKPVVRPTRLRRPSIRSSSSRPLLDPKPSTSASAPSSSTQPHRTSSSSQTRVSPPASAPPSRSKPKSRPPSSTSSTSTATTTISRTSPEYDMSDEENLPSPFLKRGDRERISRTASVPTQATQQTTDASKTRAPRKSTHTLRTMAVVNAANAANGSVKPANGTITARTITRTTSASAVQGHGTVRSSVAKAQRANEEARKILFRP